MGAYCRYRAINSWHICVTSTGAECHGNQMCQYEARAELADLKQRGVNDPTDRTLTVKGTLETGEPCTIAITVPRSFVDAWRAGK